jgi:small redox-active disulfide protein 2
MKIQIYGKGCAKCDRLMANVQVVLAELGREDVEVEFVKDLDRIAALGPAVTPVLMLDGKMISQGLAMSPNRVKQLLEPHLG